MILKCSAGHITDTSRGSLSGPDPQFKKPGDRCGQLISYDVMQGSKYCQRILKEKIMSLEKALVAARQFGGEAEANDLPSWSRDDRESIAYYYGVENWYEISIEDQNKLLLEYRYGERLEAAKDFSSKLFVEVSKNFTSADWDQMPRKELKKKIEDFVDEGRDWINLWEAARAFERYMGW